MNELTINPSEYGIEVSKANELVGNLPQIQEERSVLEAQYNDVLTMDIEDVNTSKTARALRLKIKENRTKGIEVWHKTTKDYFLKGGQFVDAIKRKEIAINQRMEENLEEIEKYVERKEAERKEALRVERAEKLDLYKDYVPFGINLGEISDDEFTKVFNGSKLQYDAKIEAEKKAEEDRLEQERMSRLYQERKTLLLPYWEYMKEMDRDKDFAYMQDVGFENYLKSLREAKKAKEEQMYAQQVENERLKKEAEAREKQLAEERAKLEAEAEKARKEAEKKLAEERRIQEEKLAKEREEREKVEAELKAKLEAERKAEEEAKAEAEKARKEAEKLAKAPVKKKMQVWIKSFELPSIDESNESIEEIKSKFEAFKKWSLSQTELF